MGESSDISVANVLAYSRCVVEENRIVERVHAC